MDWLLIGLIALAVVGIGMALWWAYDSADFTDELDNLGDWSDE